MMYTRNGDLPPSSMRGIGLERAPSYRQRRRVEVPPGYSGHAIQDGEERPLGDGMAVEERPGGSASMAELPHEPVPEPRFDGLPREPVPEPRFDRLPRVSEAGMTVSTRRGPDLAVTGLDEPESVSPGEPTAMAMPRGGLFDAGHFPFGHGFGFEELLLLGLMWLLLHEARESGESGDLEETLLMLGALLLAG